MAHGGRAAPALRLTRREALVRGGAGSLAALVAAALPALDAAPAGAAAVALPDPSVAGATLQAFADTILPGRRVARTESGQPVHPQAIAGVDARPGAVEADALLLFGNADVGFSALEPTFLADLEARALPHGGPFLALDFDRRVAVCQSGLDASNPTFLIWEAAAAVPFTAFCAAALVPEATWETAVGYRVMGLPGAAPNGYRGYSWQRRLSRERTATGSLP